MNINISGWKCPYIFLLVIIFIISIFYLQTRNNQFYISNIVHENYDAINHRYGSSGIIVDFSPYAEDIHKGSVLTFNDGDSKTVKTIVGGYGPWSIWFEGESFNGQGKISFKNNNSLIPLAKFIITFIFILFVSVLIGISLFLLIKYVHIFDEYSDVFIFGASYVIGVSVFLFCWRVSGIMLGNALAGLCLSLLIFFGSFLLLLKNKNHIKRAMSLGGWFAVASSLFMIYFLLFWVIPFSGALNIAATSVPLGPFESGRYGDIANFIYETNAIPIIRQNYGQSILSSMSSFIGLRLPRLSLLFWLATSVGALLFLLIGFARKLGAGNAVSFLIVMVVLLGSPRLTLLVTQLTDNHSTPVLQNAYSDTIFSIALLLLSFCLLWGMINNSNSKFSILYKSSALFFLGTLSNICGFQSAVNFLFFFFPCFYLGFDKGRGYYEKIFAGFGAFGLGFLASLPFGGMMTPPYFFDLTDGLVAVYNPPRDVLSKLIFYPHSAWILFNSPDQWYFANIINGINISNVNFHSLSSIYENISKLEQVIVANARSLFIIIISIVGYQVSKKKDNGEYIKFFCLFVVLNVILGSLLSYMFSINSISKILLRFMNGAYFFGMILFGYVMGTYAVSTGRRRNIAVALLFLCLVGQVAGISLQIIGAYEKLNFAQKVNLMTSIPYTTRVKLYYQDAP